MNYQRILHSVFLTIMLICSTVFSAQTAFAAGDMQPISFEDNPDPVAARGEVTYTIDVHNNSTNDADNPTLVLTIPAGFTFVSVNNNMTCTYDSGNDTVACSAASLLANTSYEIEVVLRASDTAGTYQLTATADCVDDENTANNSEGNFTEVVKSADLALSKTSTPEDNVDAGGILTYNFAVNNAGPYAAEDMVVTDTLPGEVVFFGDDTDDWACFAVGQDVSCTASTLADAATSNFSFRVQVTSATTGDITNSATVSMATMPDSVPYNNNTDTDDIHIDYATDMSISKTVDTNPVIGGQPVQFTLTVTNEGPMTATDVEVLDTLELDYDDISVITTPAGWGCTVDQVDRKVNCTNSSVPANESVDIVIQATPRSIPLPACPPAGDVTHQNTAQVSTATTDPISANNSVTIHYIVNPDTALLSISKTKSPDPVAKDEEMTSTIVVTNDGTKDADPVTVTDELASGETWVGIAANPPSTGWACVHRTEPTPAPNPGGFVDCIYNAPLTPGETAPTLTLTTVATEAGTLTNQACVTSPDDARSCNACADGSVPSTSDKADLVVTKTTDDAVIDPAENSFTYTVTVHNNGPDTAVDVDFRDTIPMYIAASTGGRPATTIAADADLAGANCSVTDEFVRCDLEDIANGATVTVTITVTRPMQDGTFRNFASAYSTQTGDPNRGNNEDWADVTVDPVTDIEVTEKNVTYTNPLDDILAGTIATYTIGVRNNGPSVAENVTVADIFTGQPFTFIDATVPDGSCGFDNPSQTVNCTLGDMDADTTKYITVEIRPDHQTPAPGSWDIDNTATAGSATTDSNTNNDHKSKELDVQNGQADLAIEKRESAAYHEPVRFYIAGSENYIVYEIIVSNRGPSLATGVQFVDNVTSVYPANGQQLQFVRDTSNADGSDGAFSLCAAPTPNPFDVDGSDQDITCQLINDPAKDFGELASGDSYTRYIVFKVLNQPDAVIGDVYQDTVTVEGNEEDNNPDNDTESEGTTIRVVVDLELKKEASKTPVEVEEDFYFDLTVTNHGQGDSPETTVTDTLPPGMVLTTTPTPSVGTCTGSAGDSVFSCNLGFMLKDAEATITMPVKLTTYPAGGTIKNCATVSGLAPEPDPDDTYLNEGCDTVAVYQPAILGDFVWLDRNADGIQEGGEPGISGVTVNLRSNGSQVDTTTTNGSGQYSFTINHAAPTDYIVEFVPPADYLASPQDAGSDDTADSDADDTTGRTAAVSINYGNTINTVDAGMYQLVGLGDRLWLDDNADGTQDSGELGIVAVTVNLLNDSLTQIASTTTDINGDYHFTDLVPGEYSVRITPPARPGYLASPVQTADPDNDVNNDSNIDTTIVTASGTYQSGPVTLSSGSEPTGDGDNNNSNSGVDFGLVLPGSIGNLVWLDENSDGIQDAGEPGLASITVQLKDNSGTPLATTVTDSHGGYLFKGVAPGDYFVAVDGTTLPAGMSQTTTYPNQNADFHNQDQSGNGYSAHVTSQGENLTADFGYNWSPTVDVTGGDNTGALGNRIWIDSDGDGAQDPAEAGVTGVTVTLYDIDGTLAGTTTTDAAGYYIFDDLAVGVYSVAVTGDAGASHAVLNPANYTPTGDPDHFAADSSTAPAGTAGDNRSTQAIIIAPGDTFINADFGYQPEASAGLHSIGETIWVDANRNGVVDGNEPFVSGVTVGLQNGGGKFIATTTTNILGEYHFYGLPDATYTVVITDSENILSGFHPTYDSDSLLVNPDEQSTLTLAGADDLFQNFGYIPNGPDSNGTGLIGDTIFLDRDGSDGFNEGEGLEGVRVLLRDQGSGNSIATVRYTDKNGVYLFGELAAGTYTVEVDTNTLPGGVTNSVDLEGDNNSTSPVTLGNGSIILNRDFGYIADSPGSIGNFVWKDTNADGVYQANGLDTTPGTADDETGFDGVSLDLFLDIDGDGKVDPGEPMLGSTTTASGAYLFTGLPGGDYNVKVTDSASILGGFWHSNGTTDFNNNSQVDYYHVTLPDNGTVLTGDFGYYVHPGSLGNRVWKDVNADGIYDFAADTALDNITVFLDISYSNGSTTTLQTVTGADGLYHFPSLLLDENHNGIGAGEPSHTVRLDEMTIPAGLTTIYPSRGSNTDTTTVGGAVADNDDQDMGSDNPAGEPGFPLMGSADITNDFGYFEPGSIGDTIWDDANNDGLLDGGEGLGGVDVVLTPPADVDLGNGLGTGFTTTTNATGIYLFFGLPPGIYTVTVDETTLPAALQVAGSNTVDPDGGNDSTSQVTLGVAEDNFAQDFAYFVPDSIGDYVWDDSNGNGIQDPAESGHMGITVRLLDNSGNPVEDPKHPGVPYVVQTDGAGQYLFINLLPGTYQVQFDLPTGIVLTSQNSGADDELDSDPDPADSNRVTIILGLNAADMSIDAGLVGAAINIEKSTNGVDADTSPGVPLFSDDAITWEYIVTNTGSVDLTDVTVYDDRIGIVSCPENTLATSESMSCTATGIAIVGLYSNIAYVIGTPLSGPAVVDSDPSHYIGSAHGVTPVPAIDIEKSTDGMDADTGTGPVITIGDPVAWSYLVTNTGTTNLVSITVNDDKIGVISCPETTLASGSIMTCSATGTAVAGQYENIATVFARAAGGITLVTDSDPSHYFGSTPGVDIPGIHLEKGTNGQDADVTPGPFVEIGYTVIWTYYVANTGNVNLTNVTITDNMIDDADIHCQYDGNLDNRILLMPPHSLSTCTATGIAIGGQYANIGSVVGTPPVGDNVSDTDPSHYYGDSGSIDIEKYTNGEDADLEKGPFITIGRDVNWTYQLTNTGKFPLSNVTVNDDQGVAVNCSKNNLAPAEVMTCTAEGIAVKGQYANIGSVTAVTPAGGHVSDTDPSHYFGKSFIFIPPSPCATFPVHCYMIADWNTYDSNDSPLLKYTFRGDTLELVNWLGVSNVETMAYSLDGKILYATDGGVLGIVDQTKGSSNSFKPIDPAGVGRGFGVYGEIIFNDIDGISFDPKNGVLFGTVRYEEGKHGFMDLLIQIDPVSGHVIKNGFGSGRDYVIVDTKAVGVSIVDDIAFDRRTGILYGVAGIGAGGGEDQGVIINKETGTVSLSAPLLAPDGSLVQDMEGFTVFNHKYFYGTTGIEFPQLNTSNMLYRIDKSSGTSEAVTNLDRTIEGYEPSDIEAISCFPVCK